MLRAIIIASIVLPIHSAPTGMIYPHACCANQHCHPVPCEEILEQNDGSWIWYTFRFNKNVVKPSEDKRCHVCTIGPNGVCAFIVQGT